MFKNILKVIGNSNNIKDVLRNSKYYDILASSELFDEKFYCEYYPDVLESGQEPLLHYLTKGYLEGKNPSEAFDSNIYYACYPHVKVENINPLVHYLAHGKNEGKFYQKSESIRRKEEICKTNLMLLNNYEFDSQPLVSIIILTRDGIHHLKRLFTDFDLKTNYSNYEIIVVDNASSDGSVEYLESLDLPIRIIKNDVNVSFSKGNNDAAKIANGEYVLLLNNDIEPTYGWLNEIMGTMIYNEDVAAVGAKLIFPYYFNQENSHKSFKIQHVGDCFAERMCPCCLYARNKSNPHMSVFNKSINVNSSQIAVTGALMLIDKKVYDELGGLDEDYNYGLEDVDFSLKLYKNGYKTLYCGSALLFHHESSTRVKTKEYLENDRKNFNMLWSKWGDFLSKNMLEDKINKKKFFTEKDLNIVIVDLDFTVDSQRFSFISKLIKLFNENSYEVNLICDERDFFLGDSPDILISFSKEYDISSVKARDDLLTLLVIDDKFENNLDYDAYLSPNEKPNNDFIMNCSFNSPEEFVDSLFTNIKKLISNENFNLN